MRPLGYSGQIEHASREGCSCLGRTTGEEDGVLSAEGADDLVPALRIDGFGDRLRASRERVENDELRDSIDTREELWQETVERWFSLVRDHLGQHVARSVFRRNAHDAKVAQV